ncbi:F-box protein At2g17036-like [Corylus avellana]|uniref:F-box protein At2g17036-like n=1 Tax=Corylus avellana TaxID=13451 RepID=UPI001E228203|nr:F-box protein At2g17036-like [Corylus avellana]
MESNWACLPDDLESNWACLPDDLLVLILDRLITLSDYVCFSAVCMPWQAIALENYYGERRHKLSLHQPPLLFLTHTHPSIEGETTISVHNISHQDKTYELKSFIPNGNDRWFCSSHGWLITVDNNFVITLSNPFCSDGIICLPRVFHVHWYDIQKVILSIDPVVAPDDYIVMVICSDRRGLKKLAFIKPGDKGWTHIVNKYIMDVIYSKGLFYALYAFGAVKTFDISENFPKLNMVSTNCYTTASYLNKKYLVESTDDEDILKFVRILVVINDELPPRVETIGFNVFKLLVLDGEKKWVETRDPNVLGGGALFLDDNTSTYVPASDILGCNPNSIYFVDCCLPGYNTHPAGVYPPTSYDMGIFYLGDRSFQWHCVLNSPSSPKSMSHPMWIKPTFQGK